VNPQAQAVPPKAPIEAVWRVVKSPALSDAEVRLWLYYRSKHFDASAGAYPTDLSAANELGWSERKVQAVRAELKRHGLLDVRLRGPQPAANFPLDPAQVRGPQRPAAQTPQKPQSEPQNPAGQDPPGSAGQASKDPQEALQNPASAYKERTCKPEQPGGTQPGRQERQTPRKTTDAQELTNHVIAVGMHGQRFSDYPKQANRADALLRQHPLAELKRAADALRGRYPYSDGRAFDVFDLGKNIDKVLGELNSVAADPAIARALRERDRLAVGTR